MQQLRDTQIDFDIHKLIETERKGFHEPDYVVLRRLLKLPPLTNPVTESVPATSKSPGDWFVGGIRVPEGTQATFSYKGHDYTGEVKQGALHINGHRFTSPSAASIAISKNSRNGWRDWRVQLPGQTQWVLLDVLRHRLKRDA